jgi:hypothetical protein
MGLGLRKLRAPHRNEYPVVGTIGLAFSWVTFAIYFCYSIVARFELLSGQHLPLPKSFGSYTLCWTLISGCIGFLGVFLDKQCLRSNLALASMLAIVGLVGLLKGFN